MCLFFLFFFGICWQGNRSIWKYFELSDSALSMCPIPVLRTCLLPPFIQFFAEHIWDLFCLGGVTGYFICLCLCPCSAASAVGRHWTPHFGMQCLDPIKWHWKEMFKQYLKENGAWGLGLKLVSNSSEFYLDWWASANSLVDLLVGLLLHENTGLPSFGWKSRKWLKLS